jgi:hypothetical protein
LELHTLPGVLGGTLSGSLETPSKVHAEDGFKLRLICIQRTTSGSGKNRSTRERVLWEEQKTIVRDFLELDQEKTGLPVFFNVPFDQPESLDDNPAILWRLEVVAEVPGVDYSTHFEVPVFKTAESRADAAPVEDPTASFQPPPGTWSPPTNSRITVSKTPQGTTEIRFPAARHPGVIMGLLLFITLWTGAIGFMITKQAPLLFPIVFGLFDLLLVGFVFQLVFHSINLSVGPYKIVITHRLLFLNWKHLLEPADVESIQLHAGMQSGTRVYYDLALHTREGRKLTAGSRITDKKHAQWLVSRIGLATGIAR